MAGYDAGVSQIDRHRITHVVVFVLLATFGAAGALLGGLRWVLTGLAVVGHRRERGEPAAAGAQARLEPRRVDVCERGLVALEATEPRMPAEA